MPERTSTIEAPPFSEAGYAVAQPTAARRPAAAETQEVSVSLFDLAHRLVRGRWLLLGGFVLGAALGALLAYVTKPYFLAEATFLPPKQPEPMLAASASALLMPHDDPTDMYLGLLASRSVKDDVIDHVGLMQEFKIPRSRLDARNTLGGMSKFKVSKNELITVSVAYKDPVLAARIANAYLDALYRLNGSMVASASSHREQFFDQQLREQKEALARAESDLRTTEEKTGILLPQGDVEAGLSTMTQLQQQINAAETRLSGLLAGATEQNPEVVQARSELAALRGQLARQQAATGSRRAGAGLTSNSELPALTLEYTRKARELKQRETVYDALMQQYERARLASSDPGPQLQIVDPAIAPERKAGPSKRIYTMVGAALGLFAALGYLLFSAPLANVYRSYRGYTRASVAR